MITKGIITAIDFTGNTCTVRMPFFETAGNDEIIGTATISNTPGSYNGYKVGDVVWVAFEDNKLDTPVVIGKLYLGVDVEKNDPRGAINVESSITTKNASIPADTKLSSASDIDVPNTAAPYKSISGLTKELREVESGTTEGLRVLTTDISTKVSKENDGRATGFGWLINDEGWKVTSYDSSHQGLDAIDIFKVDNSGVTVAGDVKIVGYPTKTIVLYAQNQNPNQPPDFVPEGSTLPEGFPSTVPGTWSTSEPSWQSGYYIWQKTLVFKYQYNSTTKALDEVWTATTVCISGANGQNGTSGQDAVSYWLDVSTPVHLGTNQSENITIRAFKKIGLNLETVDDNAYIRYSWDDGTTWTNWVLNTTFDVLPATVLDNNDNPIPNPIFRNENLKIQAAHAIWGKDANDNDIITGYNTYESETITYAPLDTPVLDLTNDSASLAYYGNLKLDNAATVSSTAAVYLGTDTIPATYLWTFVNCSGSGANTATVVVDSLSANSAAAICTATCTNLRDENGDAVTLTKTFTITKQISAAQYWLKVDSPIHIGKLQKADITLTPMVKIGDETERAESAAADSAYIRYKWGDNGSFNAWSKGIVVVPHIKEVNNVEQPAFEEADLIIEAAHRSGTSPSYVYTVYDTEKITYSPLNTPVIDLSNDSDSLPYEGNDIIEISEGVSPVVESTATVYLNGEEVALSNFQYYRWELTNCEYQSSGADQVSTTVHIDSINTNQLSGYATFKVKFKATSDYPGLELEKKFTVAKQLKGADGADGASAIRLVIENDFDSIPANANGVISDYDYTLNTKHTVKVYEGGTTKSFRIQSDSASRTGRTGYIVTYKAEGLEWTPGTASTVSYFEKYINALTADKGTITYKLFDGSAETPLDTGKFEAVKIKRGIDGEQGPSAVNYWLDISTNIHTGNQQVADITVTAYKKVGNNPVAIDTDANISYRWDDPDDSADDSLVSNPFTPIAASGIVDRISNVYPNKNLVIQASHTDTTTNITTVYATETVTYSPLNTPVLDLSRDSAALAYSADGSSLVNPGDYVESMATAYLNGQQISGAVYTWTLTNCTGATYTNTTANTDDPSTGAVDESLVGRKIRITGLSANTATATCIVSNIGYNGLTISKEFTIVKQLQGKSIEDVGEYYFASAYGSIAEATAANATAYPEIENQDGTFNETNVDTNNSNTNKWWTTIQTTNASKKYLWNFEVITYNTDEGEIKKPTQPAVIAIWTKDGKGITSIDNYYKVTQGTSLDTIPTATSHAGWSETPLDVDRTNRYLWNFEVITYTEGAPEYTEPNIIGAYGQDAVDYDIIVSSSSITVNNNTNPATRTPSVLTVDFKETIGQDAPIDFNGKYKLYNWVDGTPAGSYVLYNPDNLTNGLYPSGTTTVHTLNIPSGLITQATKSIKVELYANFDDTGNAPDWQMVESETIEILYDGENSTSYWTDVSAPVHTGALQALEITAAAWKQTGIGSPAVDDAAIFFINNSQVSATGANGDNNIAWVEKTAGSKNTLHIPKNLINTTYASSNFTITTKHSSTTIDTEEITYSPKNTPVLDLSNDSASIAYDGNTKLGSDVSSTATVYLNGETVTATNYKWELSGCTSNGSTNNVTTASITIDGLTADNATATCKVWGITDYPNITSSHPLTKVFTITKQLKGVQGTPGQNTYSISIANDFVTVPADQNNNAAWTTTSSPTIMSKTEHIIYCYEGSHLLSNPSEYGTAAFIPVTIGTTAVSSGVNDSGYYLRYVVDGTCITGVTTDTTSYLTVQVNAVSFSSATTGDIQYTLYKDGTPVAIAKFELSKLTAGQNSVSYWLNTSTPIHLGRNQQDAITVQPMWKIGTATEEPDADAKFKYSWDGGTTWLPSSSYGQGTTPNYIYTIPTNSYINHDLIVKAYHGTTEYDSETITFTEPNAVVIDLSNDSDAIAYEPDYTNGGLKKVTNSDTVTSTAKVYKGTTEYTNGCTFSWSTSGILPATLPSGKTQSDYFTTSGNTITVKDIVEDSATATVTATVSGTTGYPAIKDSNGSNIQLTKVFTITKQTKGESAVSYWINVDATQISRDPNLTSNNTQPTAINVTFKCQVGSNAPVDFTTGYAEVWVDDQQTASNQINTSTISESNKLTLTTTSVNSAIKIILYDNSTDLNELDRETIPVVKAGLKGDTGVAVKEQYIWYQAAASKPTAPSDNSYPDGNSLWSLTPPADASDPVWTTLQSIYDDDPGSGTTGRHIKYTDPVKDEGYALAQGKTTNYYRETDPALPADGNLAYGRNIKIGDCWFDTGYTKVDPTPTVKSGCLGKYCAMSSSIGTVRAADANATRLVNQKLDTGFTDRYNVYKIIPGDSAKNLTAGTWGIDALTNFSTRTFYTTGDLKQWDGTSWVDVAGELVTNKLTTNYLNALDITTKKITVLENNNNSFNQNTNKKLFEADGLSGNGSVTLAGFDVNYERLTSNVNLDMLSTGETGVYVGTEGIRLAGQSTDTTIWNDGELVTNNIIASGGTIGGFTLDSTSFHTSEANTLGSGTWITTGLNSSNKIINEEAALKAGDEKWFITSEKGFGVTNKGNVYIRNATIDSKSFKLRQNFITDTSTPDTVLKHFNYLEAERPSETLIELKSGGTVYYQSNDYSCKLGLVYKINQQGWNYYSNYLNDVTSRFDISNGSTVEAGFVFRINVPLPYDLRLYVNVFLVPDNPRSNDPNEAIPYSQSASSTLGNVYNQGPNNAPGENSSNEWSSHECYSYSDEVRSAEVYTNGWKYTADLGYSCKIAFTLAAGRTDIVIPMLVNPTAWPGYGYHAYSSCDIIAYIDNTVALSQPGMNMWTQITSNSVDSVVFDTSPWSYAIDDIGAEMTITQHSSKAPDLLVSGNLMPEYQWRQSNKSDNTTIWQGVKRLYNIGSCYVPWNNGFFTHLTTNGIRSNELQISTLEARPSAIGTYDFPFDQIYVRDLYVDRIHYKTLSQYGSSSKAVADRPTPDATGAYNTQPVGYVQTTEYDWSLAGQDISSNTNTTIINGLYGASSLSANSFNTVSTGAKTLALKPNSALTYYYVELPAKSFTTITSCQLAVTSVNAVPIIATLYSQNKDVIETVDSSFAGTHYFNINSYYTRGARLYFYIGLARTAFGSGVADTPVRFAYQVLGSTSSGSGSDSGSSDGSGDDSGGSFTPPNVGCFEAGTKITMADGSLKNIEDIQTGDKVLSYNVYTGTLSTQEVEFPVSLVEPLDNVQLVFNDGTVLNTTMTHPFWTTDGWVSLKPNFDYNDFYKELKEQFTEMMQPGQKFFKIKGKKLKKVKLSKIRYYHGRPSDHKVYNLSIDNYATFFANGILGHNVKTKTVFSSAGCFDADTNILMADRTTKTIKDIKINDSILAYNEGLGRLVVDKVVNTFVFDHQNNDLVTLTFADGTILHTTKTHPFFTTDGWVCLTPTIGKHIISTMMHVGQKFYKATNNNTVAPVELTNIEYTPTTDTSYKVYNLEIDRNDTFITNGLIAHNSYLDGLTVQKG